MTCLACRRRAACLAGLAEGVWRDTGELERLWQRQALFRPAMEPARRDALLAQWHRAVERSRGWARE